MMNPVVWSLLVLYFCHFLGDSFVWGLDFRIERKNATNCGRI